jgi:hypothetical protein
VPSAKVPAYAQPLQPTQRFRTAPHHERATCIPHMAIAYTERRSGYWRVRLRLSESQSNSSPPSNRKLPILSNLPEAKLSIAGDGSVIVGLHVEPDVFDRLG